MPLAGSEDAVPKGEPYERAATQSTERKQNDKRNDYREP